MARYDRARETRQSPHHLGRRVTMDDEIAAVTGEYESPEVETKLLISRQCN
ncbi:hypothetical protein [Nocardia sp. alder85J]|uniref:hypothetical protein n=1 Tax=Nocardia sp. alder85J TaxID=2862949 RepID=UPI001CD1EE21|nr:hypothetical protein [Nocardia sp. alder85J]MCX4099082.1 hypothetical protein [Nocardia sp. alder85J]